VESGADRAWPLETRLRLTSGVDPLITMAAVRHGPRDPQTRVTDRTFMRALRTPVGPASLRVSMTGSEVRAQAWGPGADYCLSALPDLVGERDDPAALVPRHALIKELIHRLPGLRLTRGWPVMDVLVPSIIGQKITSMEAQEGHRRLLLRHGEPAPGPMRLMSPPPPEKLARMPYWAYHPLGIERRRADTIRAAAAVAPRLEEIARLPHETGTRRLLSLPGVGPWTAAETMRVALGDPDAVSVGDYNLPRLVCWALAAEPDGDDARMLELLEPYRGQRGRVVLLIEHAGLRLPRHGPRRTVRSIAHM
jgi:3-methyladenine DNA glycosylase/8-oxoguanine DNA glycosylase